MGKKLTIQYVKDYIETFDYELVSTEYKNALTKLDIKCPMGHNFQMTIHCFKKGKRCSVCFKSEKHTYEYVKNHIESVGYKLLSPTYTNCMTKLKIACDIGHEYECNYNKFKLGRRCRLCFFKKNSGENNFKWNKDRTRRVRLKYLQFDLNKIDILKDDINYNVLLESKLNKNKDYVVDHIIPRVSIIDNNFDIIYGKEICKKIINSKDNLKIITNLENGSKSGKYNQEDFIQWFYKKLKEFNYAKELIC